MNSFGVLEREYDIVCSLYDLSFETFANYVAEVIYAAHSGDFNITDVMGIITGIKTGIKTGIAGILHRYNKRN